MMLDTLTTETGSVVFWLLHCVLNFDNCAFPTKVFHYTQYAEATLGSVLDETGPYSSLSLNQFLKEDLKQKVWTIIVFLLSIRLMPLQYMHVHCSSY